MANKCKVGWCVVVPLPGQDLCPMHEAMPLLHSWENPREWGIRYRRTLAARRKAAERAAESDTVIAERGKKTDAAPR